jgi:sugar lactone lactonase YvrE
MLRDPEVLATGLGFVEAPTYDEELGLLVADETVGGIWRLGAPGEPPEVVVPHRRGISGCCVTADGAIVVTGRNVALKRREDDRTTVLVAADETRVAFGDLTVDPAGRILVGALGFRPDASTIPASAPGGQLLRIEPDGAVTVLNDAVVLPNGLGFSPGQDELYLVDTISNHVLAHEVSGTGEIGPARVLVTMPVGVADGMAVAEDGSLWIATLRGGGVLRVSARGEVLEHLEVGVAGAVVTSLCFAGPGLDDLVVTVVDGSTGTGSVLRWAGLGVRGVRVPRAARGD